MTVTWTSGYGINEAEPLVEWGPKGGDRVLSAAAGTLTFDRNSMCGVYHSYSEFCSRKRLSESLNLHKKVHDHSFFFSILLNNYPKFVLELFPVGRSLTL